MVNPSSEVIIFLIVLLEICIVSWNNLVRPCRLASPGREATNVQVPSRAFPKKSLTCSIPRESKWKLLQNTHTSQGLFYHNLIPSDDDILGSVALQLAPPDCPVRAATTTETAFMMNYTKRDQSKSFLYTFVRSPTERAIRDFFHHMVTVRHYEPSDVEFQAYLEERGYYNRNLLELSLKEDINDVHTTVVSIVENYDFLGIADADRLDESLVVLKLLLGLEMQQILYLEDPTPFLYELERCYLITETFVSPAMTSYFASQDWKNRIQGDALLYKAAQASLERTIDALGRTIVLQEVQRFRKALQIARDQCLEKTTFLCNLNGVWQRGRHSCIVESFGCATSCLLSKDMKLRLEKLTSDGT
jgi:hypothetical protein